MFIFMSHARKTIYQDPTHPWKQSGMSEQCNSSMPSYLIQLSIVQCTSVEVERRSLRMHGKSLATVTPLACTINKKSKGRDV